MSVAAVEGMRFDLNDPALFGRGIPHVAFESIRSTPGLTWIEPSHGVDRGYWAVTRWADVVEVSRDPARYSSAVGHIQTYDIDDDALAARASMIDIDPPQHTRLRRLVSSAFTPKHVRSYRSAVRARVRKALDALVAAGGGDWVDVVAKAIPIGVICDLLGVPDADHGYMTELSDHLVAGTSSTPLPADAYGNTIDLRLLPFNSPAASALAEYALALGERRRCDPDGGLVTQLTDAELDGERLSPDEFANFFRLLIFAGNETTRSAMSHLALHLVEFAAEFDRVRADRDLLATAVDEVIRYSSPILYFRRTATRDVELSGTPVAAGDKVVMWYAAANFDAERFADPLRFDVARTPDPPHLAFGGGGPHFCLGAALARLELAELLDEVLDRELRFDLVGEPDHVDSNFVNGIEHLAVAIR